MSYDTKQSSRYSQKPIRLFLFYGSDNFGPYGFTDAETAITRDGQTFDPWPIVGDEISQSGSLDKSDTTISMAIGSALDPEYLPYPPSQVVNLTIFEGTDGETVTTVNFPAVWVGRVESASPQGRQMLFSCLPAVASMKRSALRRNYQLTCPHSLYGSKCQASKVAATSARVVASIERSTILLTVALATPAKFAGGLLEWTGIYGRHEVRTILRASDDGFYVTVRGSLPSLGDGDSVNVIKGCNRIWNEDCTLVHNNVLNFGGQPFIPLENPISNKNQFF